MSRRWETIWLVVASGACLLALPVGAVGAILSPMVFDPRSNLLNPAAWLAFLLIVTFWIVCILGPFGAWIAHQRRMQNYAWLAVSTPLIWGLAAIAMLGFVKG